MKKWTVELLHHDSPTRYKHFGVQAIVNGSAWVELYKEDGTIVMFPTHEVFRLKLTPESGGR
jgi:hypothetical protein